MNWMSFDTALPIVFLGLMGLSMLVVRHCRPTDDLADRDQPLSAEGHPDRGGHLRAGDCRLHGVHLPRVSRQDGETEVRAKPGLRRPNT